MSDLNTIEPEVKKMGRPKKAVTPEDIKIETPPFNMMDKLMKEIDELKKRDEENQGKLSMLEAVADKGRVLSYETKKSGKKPISVKLSVFQEGLIIGWKTIKDRLILHPQTGKPVGEEQEYELTILEKDGTTRKHGINSYSEFSAARYDKQVVCPVVGKKEDYDGNLSFEVSLPDGRTITQPSQFVN